MTNLESYPNARVESAQPDLVEKPAQMADERRGTELSADEQESLAGGTTSKYVGYNHNQNLARENSVGGETPVVDRTEPAAEEAELDADEQVQLAGGIRFTGFNHNQSLAAENTTGGEKPAADRTEPAAEVAELDADEQEQLAGGSRYTGFNHNQSLAACRYGILATAAAGPIVITVEQGRIEVFSSPYLSATEPTDDYAAWLSEEAGVHTKSIQCPVLSGSGRSLRG